MLPPKALYQHDHVSCLHGGLFSSMMLCIPIQYRLFARVCFTSMMLCVAVVLVVSIVGSIKPSGIAERSDTLSQLQQVARHRAFVAQCLGGAYARPAIASI